MDELWKTRRQLNSQIDTALESDAIAALTAIADVQRDMSDRQRKAVRAAATDHTWAEIGDALGVSKQAAHQKFAKEWANTVKAEVKSQSKTIKAALRQGDYQRADAERVKLDATIAEIKAMSEANRRKKK